MPQDRRHLSLTTIGETLVVRFVDRSFMEDETIEGVSRELHDLIDSGEAAGRGLVLNLDDLEFFRSMFLATLLRLREKVRASGGRLAIVARPESFAYQTFEVVGAAKTLFTIFPDEGEALAAI